MKGKGKDGKELTKKERGELEKEWLDRVQEAITQAKMRGDVPKGMERLVEGLHSEEIDWRSILSQYITNQIPYNECYSRPSKKSVSTGVYMPHQLKEKVDIVIAVDLSGSIGKEEYISFISEVIGMAKAYQSRITMRFYSHDVQAYSGITIENGNIDKIKNME